MSSNSKMKIILIGPCPPPYGGGQAYLEQLSTQLNMKGYKYQILNTRSKRDVFNKSSLIKGLQRGLKYLCLMLRLAKAEGNIVHCLSSSYGNFFANGALIISAKILRKKTIISLLGGGFPSVVQSSGLFKKFSIKMIFKFADKIIACNEQIKESIITLNISDQKISFISNALSFKVALNDVLSTEVECFLSSHHPLIASMSALLPEYGTDVLLKAVAQLKAEFPNLGLVLVVLTTSDKRTTNKIHNILRVNELWNNVLIVKNVCSLSAIIKKSDLFVRSTLLDGDSISVRKALFLGVPVVASDTTFRPKGVVLFKKGNINDLHNKIKRVLENPRKFLSKYTLVEAYDNLQKIESIYKKLGNLA